MERQPRAFYFPGQIEGKKFPLLSRERIKTRVPVHIFVDLLCIYPTVPFKWGELDKLFTYLTLTVKRNIMQP